MPVSLSDEPSAPQQLSDGHLLTARDPRARLHFLDGLRGLACLYVLVFHASTPRITGGGELSGWMKFLCQCFGRGHFSVVFFIVLSGFSLMLPVARAGTARLEGGLVRYVKRRARRIFPPYYVALLLSMALIAAYDRLSVKHGFVPMADDGLGFAPVVSHLFLVHNVRLDWVYRINSPMWSVATEWQIYFVFALVLLPIWRSVGGALTLVFAWVAGSLPYFVLPSANNYYWASPWFIGSFALGMYGAVIAFAPTHRASWLRTRVPWATLSALCFVAIVLLVSSGLADSWSMPAVDLTVSLFAFCLINACCSRFADGVRGEQTLLLRVFSARALVYLGGFSYSLYLVQHPILRLAEKLVPRLTSNRNLNIQIQLLVVVPTAIALAWIFAELFERPFTSGGVIWPWLRQRRTAVGPSVTVPESRH